MLGLGKAGSPPLVLSTGVVAAGWEGWFLSASFLVPVCVTLSGTQAGPSVSLTHATELLRVAG